MAEAQRLLRELDYSMAMYDSTHGSHSAAANQSSYYHGIDSTSDLIGTIGSMSGASGQAAVLNAVAGAELGTGAPSLGGVAPERIEEQPQGAMAVEGDSGKSELQQPKSVLPGGVHQKDPSLVMAGEDLDDLM